MIYYQASNQRIVGPFIIAILKRNSWILWENP